MPPAAGTLHRLVTATNPGTQGEFVACKVDTYTLIFSLPIFFRKQEGPAGVSQSCNGEAKVLIGHFLLFVITQASKLAIIIGV